MRADFPRDKITLEGFHPQPNSNGLFARILIRSRRIATGPKSRPDIFVISNNPKGTAKRMHVNGVTRCKSVQYDQTARRKRAVATISVPIIPLKEIKTGQLDRKNRDMSPPGDPKIFLEHMRYLIPDERERKLLLDWLAWLVQHPDQKIMYAVLIVGLERTGKSWLGYMLRKLLGDSNVAMVGDEDPVGDTFNGWTENKLLGVVHELADKIGLKHFSVHV